MFERIKRKMSVFPLGGNATHEVVPKTMKRFRVAGLGEDVRNVVTRANVVERQGVVNHRMMINIGVCDSKMPEAAKISTTTRDSDTTLIVFVNRGGTFQVGRSAQKSLMSIERALRGTMKIFAISRVIA